MTPLHRRTHILVDLHILSHKLDLRIGVLDKRCKTLLDGLDLLRNSTKDTLFESIKLIKASPRSNLTKTNENTTHGLEIKGFVTAENEDKAAKLNTKSLD